MNNYITQINGLILKYRYILLGLIVSLSLLVRLVPMPEAIRWQDTGTELLTAYHAAMYQEYPRLGVHAASIEFFHPPWYLYVLGFLLGIVKEYIWLISLSAIIHALAVIPLFFITTWTLGASVGLVAAFLYATGGLAIPLAWTLQSQNIIVPIVLFVSMMWLYARRTHNAPLLLVSAVLWTATTTVNYASFALIPLVFFIPLFDRPYNWKRASCWIFAWVVSFVVLYMPLFQFFGVWHVIWKLLFIPMTLIRSSGNMLPHHGNIFIPVMYVLTAWAMITVYNASSRRLHIWSFFVIFASFCITGVVYAYKQTSNGDLRFIQTCASSTAEIMRRDRQKSKNMKSRFILIDEDHPNNWPHFALLIESALKQKLVTLDAARGFFNWPKTPDTTYVLCMKTKISTHESFLAPICSAPYAPASEAPVTRFTSTPSRPCSLYTYKNITP